jgi:hypothetical protein
MGKRATAAKKDSTANLGFEAKLWLTADKLRNNMDAAEPSGTRRPARQGQDFLVSACQVFEADAPKMFFADESIHQIAA